MNWSAIRTKMALSAEKYRYYFGDYAYSDYSKGKIANKIPKTHVGWGQRAVEMRGNKTHFDRFENDTLGLTGIMEKYHGYEAFDKIKEDVLVCGCGFLTFTGDQIMPFTAEEATGTYDWRTQNLKDGVAVFRENQDRSALNRNLPPDSYMEFTPTYTVVGNKDNKTMTLNTIGRPLIGLLTYGSTTKRPFGRSVLSRPARDAITDASRTVRQAEVAAYHYNVKVDVILGADNETPVEKVEAQTGDILKIGANSNGQIPSIGEFAQHAMAPFNDSILMAARNFCAATKLSLANLGISTDAPQSTEALEIVSDDLKGDILEWQSELGTQLKYFAVTLWMLENDVRKIDNDLRQKINETVPVWEAVYDFDVSKFGDGLGKIAEYAPGIVKARSLWRGLGLTSEEIDEVIKSAELAENSRQQF